MGGDLCNIEVMLFGGLNWEVLCAAIRMKSQDEEQAGLRGVLL